MAIFGEYDLRVEAPKVVWVTQKVTTTQGYFRSLFPTFCKRSQKKKSLKPFELLGFFGDFQVVAGRGFEPPTSGL